MTEQEYKTSQDHLMNTVKDRDRAQGMATIWKGVSITLLFFILMMLADKWGWLH